MKNLFQVLSLFVLAAFALSSCTPAQQTDLSELNLIPIPCKIEAGNGYFEIDNQTKIILDNQNSELGEVAQMLIKHLCVATGFDFVIENKSARNSKNSILFQLNDDKELGREGYDIDVNPKQISINSNTPEGAFRAIQTLRQLLPAEIEKSEFVEKEWKVPSLSIRDYPRFEHRGAMLDVSRHFFGVEDVKRFIDFLAAYKMNKFHMHLSDDQGWRIEIKSWPKLTSIGGQTQVGGGYGGYYTQNEYTEIVNYAHKRYITLIPEIDMPGHTNAALASYPELNEDGIATELYTGTTVGFSTLATRKEITYKFVDDVIRELAELTPGPYIHIGGDESLVTEKDDYIYFIDRVQDIVLSYGKTMVGWDEIAHANLKPNAIAQFWAHKENAILAAEKKGKVIFSPAQNIYLDMKYDSTTQLGLSWAGYTEVMESYDWDPASLIPDFDESNIYGVESPLWSETIETMSDIEYMVFPRLPGIAEIAWSKPELRDWDTYKYRLSAHKDRFEAMNINYYNSPQIP